MKLVVRDLHYRYPEGVQALDGISLEIQSGGRVAIVGQNGSGKTTLAKHLNGLLRPQYGDVEIGDWNVRQHSAAEMSDRVGYLFQNPDEQIFKSRVADEVAFALECRRIPIAETHKRVKAVLEVTGLASHYDTHPYELSPSQRKWVALASVLVVDTPILVLDEPTSGQDARELSRLGKLISGLAGEGKTILVITHDMDFVADYCERLIVMKQGKIVLDGPKHRVLQQTENLAAAQVQLPHITRLAHGLGLPDSPTTLDEFVKSLAASRGEPVR